MDAKYTQVRLRRSTTDRLKSIGDMGDSYDKVINKLLDKQSDVKGSKVDNG